MIRNETRKRAAVVLGAAGLVVVLALLLVARVSATQGTREPGSAKLTPSTARVPDPEPIVLGDVADPFCWGCSWNVDAPLEFQDDLDLLAPLGDGGSNTAGWLAQFAKTGERRELEGLPVYRERRIRVEIDGRASDVLPGDDPLLVEAEPWMDQARLSAYPDIWELGGLDTPILDGLMVLDLARSWVVRGKLADDSNAAHEDFRRVIRMGRLLRQDDATVIQELIGLACIRMGVEALYGLAREENDAATMLIAGRVSSDVSAMRLLTARRLTVTAPKSLADVNAGIRWPDLSDHDLEEIVEMSRDATERRFRLAAVVSLYEIKGFGSPVHRARAEEVLDELSRDEDPLVADHARRLRDRVPNKDEWQLTNH